jgi:hypothetical protein
MAVVPHEKPSQPDIVHGDIAGAEKRLRNLKSSFSKVSGRWDRGPRFKNFIRGLVIPAIAVLCSFGFFWWLAGDP